MNGSIPSKEPNLKELVETIDKKLSEINMNLASIRDGVHFINPFLPKGENPMAKDAGRGESTLMDGLRTLIERANKLIQDSGEISGHLHSTING